jgi:hypothetical protein
MSEGQPRRGEQQDVANKMQHYRFFCTFFQKNNYIYTKHIRRTIMPKAAVAKTQVKPKATAKPKRLSKCGKMLLKYPNGIGGKIIDMKAVLREYDTPWWYT